jgi:FkbH-like protein
MFQLTWSKNHIQDFDLENIRREMSFPLVEKSAFLMWEEHCIECSVPECYSSCALFVEREDKKCSRFVNGIVKLPSLKGGDGFAVKINFRRWAKLETVWPNYPRMYSIQILRCLTSIINFLERILIFISRNFILFDSKRKLNGSFIYLLSRIYPFLSKNNSNTNFDGLYFEFYSLDDQTSGFQFEIIDKRGIRFRKRFAANFGVNKYFIPKDELPINIVGTSRARLWNETDRNVEIVILWFHLVKFNSLYLKKEFFTINQKFKLESGAEGQNLPKIKCVVFDLDNTIWNGVIGDEGFEGVKVNSDFVQLIKQLDERGIICSVASKNDFNIAWSKIESIGLQQNLLFPQINWEPKSSNILRISQQMNINLDTFAFIDDNPFERTEVSSKYPQIRTYDVGNILDLLELDEFNLPITEQSKTRRLSYISESIRSQALKYSKNTIDDFLLSCKMVMEFKNSNDNFARCHELILRSNQFNISGKKYNEQEFNDLLVSGNSLCFGVSDKFGDYGIVGFLRWEELTDSYIITDYVMSCRVAEKRVEESLFAFLLKKIMQNKPLQLKFIDTQRNQPIKSKLQNIGFIIKNDLLDYTLLELRKSALEIDPNIIEVKIHKNVI